jgi:hypothetical protein
LKPIRIAGRIISADRAGYDIPDLAERPFVARDGPTPLVFFGSDRPDANLLKAHRKLSNPGLMNVDDLDDVHGKRTR